MKVKLLALLTLGAGLLPAQSDASKRLEVAAETFKEVMGAPDKSIPQDLLRPSVRSSFPV